MKTIKMKLIAQFWPIDLKNCSQGNIIEKVKNYEHNQKNMNKIIIPILNWILFSMFNYFLMFITEAFIKNTSGYILTGITGIFCTIGIVFSIVLLYIYFFLKNVKLKF